MEALAVLREGVALDPAAAGLRVELARGLLAAGAVAEAREQADAALAGGETAEALAVVGSVLAAEEKDADALALYQRALARDATCWQAALGMARLYAKRPETRPQAQAIVEQGLRAFPRNVQFAELQKELASGL